ncbi:Gfo/Idh/MocA family protein [Actinoplanes couchii]|uniref:Oxidoreductase n=1 Tax=Actinoplanes couchii TaxID=403638 RepID=A0ABQ3XEP5_9ACTN|nr:Gfo/Idh/MocA family oxidoreductase [Actinoplanes couchii]MDR6319825.1 putative dehydrogenase [Actinoplanes couchii]GID56960.1 oxidoreductase [Actinoplanes couchii]
MSDNRLRVGVIGADTRASWAGVSHIPAIRGLDTLTLAAVATRREDSAREAAGAFEAGHWFDDPYAMIRSDLVDVVTIAVRVPAHRDLVRAALAAGKAVYCEAPLGVSLAETLDLASAAGSGANVVGLQGRFNPSVRRAAQLIGEGAIGRPLNARVVSTSAGFGPVTASPYGYFEKAESGANLLTITTGHTLDIVEALLGDLTEIDARAETLWPRPLLADTGEQIDREVPDHVDVLARTTSGVVVAVDVVGGVAPDDATFRFELRGTDGWLTLTGGTLFGVQGGDLTLTSSAVFEAPDDPVAKGVSGPAINVGELYARLAADLRTGTRTAPGFGHAAHNARLLAAVTRAATSGQRVEVASS